MTRRFIRTLLPHLLFTLVALASTAPNALAQVRERAIPFDSAGRILSITPPLAARLGLTGPTWPVTGDYVDARLFAQGETETYVIVVQRRAEALDRFTIDRAQRLALMQAVDAGAIASAGRPRPDAAPTYISEPVRGAFVVSQTLLGAGLFGPLAAGMIGDAAGATAAYLAITGGTFFTAANMSRTRSISRAQNHLSWHSALRGAAFADGALYALAGGGPSGQGFSAAGLAGGIAGDIVGFTLGAPMTDAEAHATTHGSTVLALTTAGLAGTAGLWNNDGAARGAAALVVGAGLLGYPAGLRYVRNADYTVTAGDVTTLVTSELLALGAAATFIPDRTNSPEGVSAALTAGFVVGAFAGDRFLVRPFDHTESEARLVQYGASAGALIFLAGPVLARSDNSHVIFGALTAGGILGAILTERLIQPARAREAGRVGVLSSPAEQRRTGLDIRITPEALLFAGLRQRGNHSLVSLTF